MEEELYKYVNREVSYIPLMNFGISERNLYTILGIYAYNDIFNKKLPKQLKYLNKFINPKNVIKKLDIFEEKNRAYGSLSILLLTHSDFVIDKLKDFYGDPIYHDEFGEGFDGEYDEETDEELEPEIKESFASYFVNIKGVDFHIGYDHRGLTIEIKKGTSIEKLIEALKEFIYMCYTNNDKLNL